MSAFLVEREKTNGENNIRNGIRAAIIFVDETDAAYDTEAKRLIRAAKLARDNGIDLSDNYFTKIRDITSTFDAQDDIVIFQSVVAYEKIA